MAHKAIAIANEIIQRGINAGDPKTSMHLHKILYFAQGWSLALNDEPIFREPIQAWQYGPVVPEVYQATKHWGADPITQPLAQSGNEDLTEDEKDVIEYVWESYKGWTAGQLVSGTHNEGPWREFYDPKKRGVVIPLDKIRLYFNGLYEKLSEA